MDDHITKPIDPDATAQTLLRHLTPQEAGLIPGIDEEGALRRVAGNRKLLHNLWRRFASNYGETASLIRNAMTNGDPVSVGKLIHSLTGLSGNIGAKGVYEASRALEEAFHQNRSNDVIAALVDQLENQCRSVAAAIQRIPLDDAELPALGPEEPWGDVVERLLGYCRAYDGDALIFWQTHSARARQVLEAEAWETLNAAIQSFDFQAAIDILSTRAAKE